MGEKGNPYRIFVGKPEGKRPLGILPSSWEKFMFYQFIRANPGPTNLCILRM
jgi:hypothetical protein